MLVIYINYENNVKHVRCLKERKNIMSIKTSKENICVNQIVGQKEENFMVQGDEIVPDIKPDILNIISSNGTVCIYKKEIQDGKVKFEGSVYIYTLYVADDETSSVRSISSSLDFSKTVELANALPDMQLEDLCEIKSIDCKMLNGRKISLNANLKIKVNLYSNEKIDIIKGIEDIKDIQTLNRNYSINSLLGTGMTKAYAKDTIKISDEDNLLEIVKVKMDLINKETKVSYNKVLVKADANFRIVYLTEDNRMNTVEQIIPVMGFIDIQNVTEDNMCDVQYELRNILIKPNNVEEHSVYVEAEIEVNCCVYENRQVDIIQDLYSPTIDLECKQKNIKIMQNKRLIRQTCNIRKQENIEDIGRGKIYDVEVRPTIISSQVTNGRVSYEGEINLNFMYQSKEGIGISSKNIVEPFSFNIADDQVTSTTNVETSIEVAMQDFIVMPDESIDMKIDLEFNLRVSNMENMNVINEIDECENRNREKYSIVIYYTKPGDTLWNIAKKFGSTVDEIVRVNNIENANLIYPGEQLFITR